MLCVALASDLAFLSVVPGRGRSRLGVCKGDMLKDSRSASRKYAQSSFQILTSLFPAFGRTMNWLP